LALAGLHQEIAVFLFFVVVLHAFSIQSASNGSIGTKIPPLMGFARALCQNNERAVVFVGAFDFNALSGLFFDQDVLLKKPRL